MYAKLVCNGNEMMQKTKRLIVRDTLKFVISRDECSCLIYMSIRMAKVPLFAVCMPCARAQTDRERERVCVCVYRYNIYVSLT